jgi:predicted transcriptional regulator
MQRDRVQIIIDILDILVLNEKVKRTPIMYKANLSYFQMKKYFDPLIDKGAIERRGRFYALTTWGKGFLHDLQSISTDLNMIYNE